MAQETIGDWSQFGLAGAVIGALFFSLVLVIRWMVGHIDKQAERHHSERSEWRTENKDIVARVEKATGEVAEGIQE